MFKDSRSADLTSTDFVWDVCINRSVTLTMLSDQAQLTSAVYILDDLTPEGIESFTVALINHGKVQR